MEDNEMVIYTKEDINEYENENFEKLDYLYHNIALNDEEASSVYSELYNDFGDYLQIFGKIFIDGLLEKNFKEIKKTEYKTKKELTYSIDFKLVKKIGSAKRIMMYLLRNGEECLNISFSEFDEITIFEKDGKRKFFKNF